MIFKVVPITYQPYAKNNANFVVLCRIADSLKWSLAQLQHLKTNQPLLSSSACLLECSCLLLVSVKFLGLAYFSLVK